MEAPELELATVFARFACVDAEYVRMDPWVAFFQYCAGVSHERPDLLPAFAAALPQMPSLVKPRPTRTHALRVGDAVLRGLGAVPSHFIDADGVIHLDFPGYGDHLTSEAAAHDFRFLLLAKLVMGAVGYDYSTKPVIFHVYYPSFTVLASVECSTWNTVGAAVASLISTPRPRTPGLQCLNCQKRDDCKPFQGYASRPGQEIEEHGTPEDIAQRLYLGLVLAQTQESILKERRQTLLKRFIALADDGRIKVGDTLRTRVKAETSDRFPYTPVRQVLDAAGLWRDDYARIDVKALKRAAKTFPPAIQQRLQDLVFTQTVDYGFKEIADATAYDVRTSVFHGLAIK